MSHDNTQNTLEKLPEYVGSKKGIELLGVKEAKFFYHVNRGEIAMQEGRARRARLYRVADILAVKRRLDAGKRKPEPVLLDWLYAADVPAGLKLSQRLYPGEVDLAEAAIYQSWRKNNPYLTMAAFSKDRQECYATIQVVPLASEQTIIDVLSGQREESSITPDEICAYDQPGAYNLLVTSATCLPERPALLYQVLYKYMQFWIDQYPEKYIRRVYAQAVSDSGMKIVQHFFMSPRLDLAYNAFMLDLAYPSPARMIRDFKQKLEEKAPLPDDLRWPPPGGSPAIARPAFTTPVVPRTDQHAPRVARQQGQRATGTTSERASLPDGWISAAAFAQQHNVHQNTFKKAIQTGRFTAACAGEWKSGRTIVKEALDPDGQRSFIETYRSHPGFTPCPDCPHGATTTAAPDNAPASEGA